MKKIIVLLFLSQSFISFGQYTDEVLRMPAFWDSEDTLSFNLATQDTADMRKLKGMDDFVNMLLEKVGNKSSKEETERFLATAPVLYTQHLVGRAVLDVRRMLKFPASLQFLQKRGDIYTTEDSVLITFFIRAENGFGNMVTREVLCAIDDSCRCQIKN